MNDLFSYNKNFLNERDISTLDDNIEIFVQKNLITNLILNRFKYEGFTRQESLFLEKVLISEGKVALIHIEGFKRPILSSCRIDSFNRYGEPVIITALPYLNATIDLKENPKSVNGFFESFSEANSVNVSDDLVYYKQFKVNEDCVVIFNNSNKTSDNLTIRNIVENLSNLRNAYKVNTNANKTPLLFKGDKTLKASFKNLFNQISANVPYIFLNTTKDTSKLSKGKETIADNIESLNLSHNYIAPQLRTEFNQELSYGLNVLGIESFSSAKKERLITDEINQNSEFVAFQRQIALTEREEALEDFNKLFGTNLKVELFRNTFDMDELEFTEEENIQED